MTNPNRPKLHQMLSSDFVENLFKQLDDPAASSSSAASNTTVTSQLDLMAVQALGRGDSIDPVVGFLRRIPSAAAGALMTSISDGPGLEVYYQRTKERPNDGDPALSLDFDAALNFEVGEKGPNGELKNLTQRSVSIIRPADGGSDV